MSQYPPYQPFQPARPHELGYGTDDRAVFNFFNAVYAWMFVGLAVTGTVAWLVAQNTSWVLAMYGRGISLALLLGVVLLAWGIRSAAHRISPGAATALFLLLAVILGAALSGIFIVYKLGTIAGAFVVTAGTFGAMSVYGYLTKRDLTGIGSILMMCVFGLFLATLVNIFVASTVVSWIVTYVALFVFIGLTAYDTQRLKQIAYATQGNAREAAKYAIIGSLELYLDFINIFLSIVRIMGRRD